MPFDSIRDHGLDTELPLVDLTPPVVKGAVENTDTPLELRWNHDEQIGIVDDVWYDDCLGAVYEATVEDEHEDKVARAQASSPWLKFRECFISPDGRLKPTGEVPAYIHKEISITAGCGGVLGNTVSTEPIE